VRNNTKKMKVHAHEELSSEFLYHLNQCTSNKAKAKMFQTGLDQYREISSVDQAYFHSLMHPLNNSLLRFWEPNKAGVIGEGDMIATPNIFITLILTLGRQQQGSRISI
jgi:hypothetical protein